MPSVDMWLPAKIIAYALFDCSERFGPVGTDFASFVAAVDCFVSATDVCNTYQQLGMPNDREPMHAYSTQSHETYRTTRVNRRNP